jgi:hypothetical protein
MQPAGTYICRYPVEHDGVRYEPKDVFPITDATVIATLRACKAIGLREEVEAAEQLAADRARVEAENAALRQQLAELQAKFSAASGGKRGAQPAI